MKITEHAPKKWQRNAAAVAGILATLIPSTAAASQSESVHVGPPISGHSQAFCLDEKLTEKDLRQLLNNPNTGDSFEYFTQESDFSRIASAVIVGTMFKESGVNPEAVNMNGLANGSLQWVGPRWADIEDRSRRVGLEPRTMYAQQLYTAQDLHSSYPELVQRMNTKTDLTEVARDFNNHYTISSSQCVGRQVAAAEIILEVFE
jgi:hypothetical protein